MRNAVKFLFLAVGLCAARSEAAEHYYFHIFGSSCFSTTSGVKAEVNQWGIYNPSTTQAMDVSCPVTLTDYYQTYTKLFIGIGGYNRSNSDALSCTFSMSNPDGYSLTSATATVRKQAGTNVVYATGYNYPTAGQRLPWVTCHVPANLGNGWSYLTSVEMTLDY